MDATAQNTRRRLSAPGSKALGLGYILLFLSTVLFDQSTKIHAERAYLVWSHPTDLRSYRSDKDRYGSVGVSPALKREGSEQQLSGTSNWIDFYITYVRNPGAAWGSFSTVPQKVRMWTFYAVTLFVSILIGYLFRHCPPQQKLTRAALVLILGGAAGNLIDRILLNYVIDWISLHWTIFGWEYSFPVFNWADLAINVGIVLMLVDILWIELRTQKGSEDNKAMAQTTAPMSLD